MSLPAQYHSSTPAASSSASPARSSQPNARSTGGARRGRRGAAAPESEPQAQVQAQFSGCQAIGQVGLQRADGAAPAQAGAESDQRPECAPAPAVGHRAGVDEQGALPVAERAAIDDGALPFKAA